MRRRALVLSLPLLLAAAAAWEQFRYRLPNGSGVPNARAVGHNLPDGSGGKNVFGWDFAALGKEWTAELCHADSDGDGQTNGQELGDPCCAWSQANYPRPQRSSGLSHPGDPTKMSDPALWLHLNCTEYREFVERAISRPTSSAVALRPSASALVVLVAGAVLAIETMAVDE